MSDSSRWSEVTAALPMDARRAAETAFWRTLAETWRWKRVADAGCGAGFHVRLLRELGLDVFGFDLAIGAVAGAPRGTAAVGDLVAVPMRTGCFDAVLCLGNTFSLLGSRRAQRHALDELVAPVAPGGVVMLQGEDVGALTTHGPVARTRQLDDGALHVRVFQRHGRRVQMLAGIVVAGKEQPWETARFTPTSARDVARMGRNAGLVPRRLPTAPPSSNPATWWVALDRAAV